VRHKVQSLFAGHTLLTAGARNYWKSHAFATIEGQPFGATNLTYQIE
jgi:hypothetical protein